MVFMGGEVMKLYKILVMRIVILGLLLISILPMTLRVTASNDQDNRINQVEEALNVSVFYQKEADRLIKCFDVNENGFYAIGYENNTVHIYDALGTFLYGYRFDTDNTYGIALKENSIVIYLGRSHNAVEIDSTGKCVSVEKVHFSASFYEKEYHRTHKQIGNTNYYLERDIGIFDGDYSRLIKIDEDGTKSVLYDVTAKGYIVGVFHYVILCSFPIAGIICVKNLIKKEEQETDG